MMFMLSDLNLFFENWQKQNEIQGPQCSICRARLVETKPKESLVDCTHLLHSESKA